MSPEIRESRLHRVEIEVVKTRVLEVYARTPEEAEGIAEDIVSEEEGIEPSSITILEVYPVDEESMGTLVRDDLSNE